MREQKKQNLTDPNVRKRFVTYKEAAELYSMGLTRIQEHLDNIVRCRFLHFIFKFFNFRIRNSSHFFAGF